jgi:hypothetical protein
MAEREPASVETVFGMIALLRAYKDYGILHFSNLQPAVDAKVHPAAEDRTNQDS